MPFEVEEPLPIGIWLSELRKLADSSANDNGDAEDRAVRRAFYFSRLSPLPVSRISSSTLSEDDLEALLGQGRAQEAAQEIVGKRAVIQLLRASGTKPHVAVLRFDDDEPVRAEAATPALAVISAWAKLLTAA